jgi:cytochrome d ubiquinol oxidase subunit I
MVGVGVLMLAMSWFGAWRSWRREDLPRWFKIGLAGMTFSGWIAVVAGWLVTEVGRQPWLIQGVMKTAEAASNVPAGSIALTLTAYALVYTGLMVSFMVVVTQLALKDAQEDAGAAARSAAVTPTPAT